MVKRARNGKTKKAKHKLIDTSAKQPNSELKIHQDHSNSLKNSEQAISVDNIGSKNTIETNDIFVKSRSVLNQPGPWALEKDSESDSSSIYGSSDHEYIVQVDDADSSASSTVVKSSVHEVNEGKSRNQTATINPEKLSEIMLSVPVSEIDLDTPYKVLRTEDNMKVILGMNVGENFTFVGSVSVFVISGAIKVAGYETSSSDCKRPDDFISVHSPPWCSALQIKCVAPSETKINYPNWMSTEVRDLARKVLEVATAVVLIKPEIDDSYDVDDIMKYISQSQNISIPDTTANNNNNNNNNNSKNSFIENEIVNLEVKNNDFSLRMSSISDTIGFHIITSEDIDALKQDLKRLGRYIPKRKLIIPPSWTRVLLSLNSTEKNVSNKSLTSKTPPSVLVCGSKDLGKSTLTRCIVNNYLSEQKEGNGENFTRVAYIDCDVGQPEFTPSGMVSLILIETPLLGPPCSHLVSIPTLAFSIGSISPKSQPARYLQAIKILYDTYRSTYETQNIPLVVNTQGWIQAMGFDLLATVIEYINPLHLIAIQGHKVSQIIPTQSLQRPERNIHLVQSWNPSVNQSNSISKDNLQSSHMRTLQLACYFNSKSCMKQISSLKIHSIASMLSCETPYVVPWKNVALHCSESDVAPSQILYAMNASIVALCCSREPLPMTKASVVGLPLVLTNTPLLRCVGYGIIRGIDMDHKSLYVLSPVPREELSQVNVLIKGSIETPIQFLFDKKSNLKNAYTTAYLNGAGAKKMRSRRNLLRGVHRAKK